MRLAHRLFALALGVASMLSLGAAEPVSPAASPVAPGHVTRKDIVYTVAEGTEVRLDLSRPAGDGPFPVVILVHGGGWTGGSKTGDTTPLIAPLNAAGFATLAIDYRLAPQHRWPACRDDVLAAIRWAKAHAAEFQGDANRIALIGYSAGGHLACFAATVVDDSTRVQAVVGLAPLTDFVQELPKRGNILGSAQRGLLNRPQEITPESLGMLRALSPVNHLRPGLPPFLLIHGDADKSVPYEQSIIFQTKLREFGVACELITLPGAPHRLTEWVRALPEWENQLVTWLKATLPPSKAVSATPRG